MAAPSKHDLKRWGIITAVVLVIAVAIYFAATWEERSRSNAVVTELEGRIGMLEADRESTARSLATAEARIQLLHARSLLFETALDLERRNFGVANERLDAAAEHLASVDAGAARIPEARLEALRTQLQEMDLRVAADLSSQRAEVLRHAQEIEDLMPAGSPVEQEAGTEGTSEDQTIEEVSQVTT